MATKDNWASLPTLPPDAIFHLSGKAKAAKEPKADLIIGAYRDAHGRPYPLPVVRKAEHMLLKKNLDYEYLPIAGHTDFINASMKMLYADSVDRAHLVGVQTLSGTGAVCIGVNFLAKVYNPNTTPVYVSNPTWPNHQGICKTAGWKDIRSYRYFDPKTVGLDFTGMKEDLKAAPSGSIFILHSCAHNPTGVDPTHEQWAEIADIMIEKQHQVFFDSAYQGYASGNLDNDAYAVRLFARKGLELLCAQSFSKNMGLYNERVGCLSVVLKDPSRAEAVKSHLAAVARTTYSNPPAHGARIAHLVLTDPKLRCEWESEMKTMSSRIKKMRTAVVAELKRLETPGNWDHITRQIGMFSFLGLTKAQCQYCQDHNVFITLTGRANMAGLTEQTAVMLARTIDAAVRPSSNL